MKNGTGRRNSRQAGGILVFGKIAIGEQDFAKMRENHYFYIDKTDFIRVVGGGR